METGNGRKNGFSSGLPTRPNATIRSPVAASMEHGRPAANTAYQAHNALIFRLFCSLRLSVRTPPFHGGESGSIPRFSSGLPTRPNATIRSPVAASMEHGRPAANTAYQANNALIFRLFCSLRLSVRTPPFHGGESGSIPQGAPRGWLPFERSCPLAEWPRRKALGLGSAPETSGENVARAAGNVRSEPITSRFPALSCFAHFSNLPQIELTFEPASSSPTLGGPKVTPSAQSQWPYAVGVAGGVTVLSRLEMAVTSCAGAKGLASMTLFGTPIEAHFSPWVPVI